MSTQQTIKCTYKDFLLSFNSNLDFNKLRVSMIDGVLGLETGSLMDKVAELVYRNGETADLELETQNRLIRVRRAFFGPPTQEEFIETVKGTVWETKYPFRAVDIEIRNKARRESKK